MTTVLRVGPNEPHNELLGEILSELRNRAHMSRAGAAIRFGFTSEYVRLIEHGRRTPAFENMPQILNAYDEKYTRQGNQITFQGKTFKFTSRVQEVRSSLPYTNAVVSNRNQKIGEIVNLLVDADNVTLSEIHRRLRRAENTASNEINTI